MLETLGPETMNIKDLSIESMEEPTEFHFDVHKYLTPERLAKILSPLENIKEANFDATEYDQDHFDKARDFAVIASCLKVLMPEVFSQLDIDDSSFDYFSILNARDKNETNASWYLGQLIYLRILFPEKVKELTGYQEIIDRSASIMSNARLNNIICYYAQYLKMLNTDLPPDTVRDIDIQQQVAKIENVKSIHDYSKVLNNLFDLKIVAPEIAQQNKLNLVDWKNIEEDIQSQFDSTPVPSIIIRNIFQMAVIAAQEVIIDDNGIRLLFPPDFEQANIPQMPETRNF